MQAEIVMRATADGLVPNDDEARALLGKLKLGDRVLVKVHRPRSIEQHRLFFALLAHVAEATSFETKERLLVALKIRLGRYDLERMPNGKLVPVPHSISFGSMPQDDFQRFFDDSIRLICAEILPGTSSVELIEQVKAMLDGKPSATERAA